MAEYILDDYGRVYEVNGTPAPLDAVVSYAEPLIPQLPVVFKRSHKWPKFLHTFLKAHPECHGCGRQAVTGHHEVPFHIDPTLELVVSNVVPVCLPCHFVVCHGGRWSLVIPTARVDLARHREIVRAAELELDG